MKDHLNEYLKKHTILKVGVGEYADLIVDNINDFLNVLSHTNYYVYNILWWEHLKIKNRADCIGGGGPIDPLDKEYYYAEVYYLDRYFSPETKQEQILQYIDDVKSKYPQNELHPGFTLKYK